MRDYHCPEHGYRCSIFAEKPVVICGEKMKYGKKCRNRCVEKPK
jgi:hypothetical protein